MVEFWSHRVIQCDGPRAETCLIHTYMIHTHTLHFLHINHFFFLSKIRDLIFNFTVKTLDFLNRGERKCKEKDQIKGYQVVVAISCFDLEFRFSCSPCSPPLLPSMLQEGLLLHFFSVSSFFCANFVESIYFADWWWWWCVWCKFWSDLVIDWNF